MAPKSQFSREQIVDAAFEIARDEGLHSITTRRVAERLGSSIAPIYVNFTDLGELKQAVVNRAYEISNRVLQEELGETPLFLDMGIASLRFAREYKVLYSDLILKRSGYRSNHESEQERMVDIMRSDPDLRDFSGDELREILLKMRVFTVGLSVMVAGSLLSDMPEAAQIELIRGTAIDIMTAIRLRKADELMK